MELKPLHVPANSTGESFKPLKDFIAWSKTPENTLVQGRLKGKMNKKEGEGHYYIIEHLDGECYGYGSCTAFDHRIAQFEEKCQELGVAQGDAILSTTFLGRLQNKGNSRSSYKFTPVAIYEAPASEATESKMVQAGVTNDEIPF